MNIVACPLLLENGIARTLYSKTTVRIRDPIGMKKLVVVIGTVIGSLHNALT
jgi:hypothetical protein